MTGGSGVTPQPLKEVVLSQLVHGEERSSLHYYAILQTRTHAPEVHKIIMCIFPLHHKVKTKSMFWVKIHKTHHFLYIFFFFTAPAIGLGRCFPEERMKLF